MVNVKRYNGDHKSHMNIFFKKSLPGQSCLMLFASPSHLRSSPFPAKLPECSSAIRRKFHPCCCDPQIGTAPMKYKIKWTRCKVLKYETTGNGTSGSVWDKSPTKYGTSGNCVKMTGTIRLVARQRVNT